MKLAYEASDAFTYDCRVDSGMENWSIYWSSISRSFSDEVGNLGKHSFQFVKVPGGSCRTWRALFTCAPYRDS
jgi:hypothetical protein